MIGSSATDGRWTIIWDGDDTLWECKAYYNAASDACWRRLVGAFNPLPFTRPELMALRRKIHLAMFRRHGYFFTIFERSWAQTVIHVCSALHRPDEADLAADLFCLAGTVKTAPYELFTGVRPLLADMRRQGHRLHLLSMGERDFQLAKVRRNGLYGLFDGIHIVQRGKQQVMHRLKSAGWPTMMVGDSVGFDMIPARALGLVPVWVSSDDPFHRGEGSPPLDGVIAIDHVIEVNQIINGRAGARLMEG